MKIEDIRFAIPEEPVDEEGFDVEKWRVENPMDYLKAVILLSMAPNKNEIFNIIYKVTRLHVPDTLFKYYSLTDNIILNEQKIDTLRQAKIFMSDIEFLNDPFDTKAFFYRPEELKKYKRLEENDGKLIDDFSSFIKVSALTSNNVNSMPMWAHYANNHKGFCVSYDMKANNELLSCTFPVQYTDQRIDITSIMNQQAHKIIQMIENQSTNAINKMLMGDLTLVYVTLLFCNIKHLSWSYENEFRCSIGAMVNDMPYIPAMPKEIYIGMNCLQTYADRIAKIATELHVPAYRMLFNELGTEFDLVYKRI